MPDDNWPTCMEDFAAMLRAANIPLGPPPSAQDFARLNAMQALLDAVDRAIGEREARQRKSRERRWRKDVKDLEGVIRRAVRRTVLVHIREWAEREGEVSGRYATVAEVRQLLGTTSRLTDDDMEWVLNAWSNPTP